MKRRLGYLRRFVAQPGQIGSVAPSSPFLTRAMLRGIEWESVDTVVELGAGTGVFTRAIDGERPVDTRFLSFEKDDSLRAELGRRFPRVEWHSDATELRPLLGRGGADCVISGLPFANFRPTLRRALLQDIATVLRPGGRFIAFQYSLQLRGELRARFADLDIELVVRNVPPAVVYRCCRRGAPVLDGAPLGAAPQPSPGEAALLRTPLAED